MRKMAWVVVWATAWMLGPAAAAETKEQGAYLLVDRTVENLNGQVGGGSATAGGLQGATQGIVTNMLDGGLPSGVPTAGVYGAGIAGGLIAGVIIDASIQSGRNKEIAAVRNPLRDGVLRRAFLGSLDRHLATAGQPVAKLVIAANPQPGMIPRMIGDDRPQTVWIMDAKGTPLVELSMDNRRVLVQAELVRYEREKGRYHDRQRARVSYLSPAPPADVDPLAYWSENNSRRVLEVVDAALGRVVAQATTEEPWPEVEKDAKLTLHVDGKPIEVSGTLLRQEGEYAYIASPGRWLRIIPGTLPPPETAVEPASGAPAATAAPAN